jgi:hypothetical protein
MGVGTRPNILGTPAVLFRCHNSTPVFVPTARIGCELWGLWTSAKVPTSQQWTGLGLILAPDRRNIRGLFLHGLVLTIFCVVFENTNLGPLPCGLGSARNTLHTCTLFSPKRSPPTPSLSPHPCGTCMTFCRITLCQYFSKNVWLRRKIDI